MIDLAAAQQMLGEYQNAALSLDCASGAADDAHDPRRKMRALNALGSVCTAEPNLLMPDPYVSACGHLTGQHAGTAMGGPSPTVQSAMTRDPIGYFDKALALANSMSDDEARASIFNNRGNFYAGLRPFDTVQADNALGAFDQCVAAGERAGDTLIVAKAWCNAGIAANTAAVQSGTKAAKFLARGYDDDADQCKQQHDHYLSIRDADFVKLNTAMSRLPDSSQKAFLLTTMAETCIENRVTGSSAASGPEAELRSAITIATNLGDARSLSYASGDLGHLYELRGNKPAAQDSTRQAIFAAQRAALPELLYRWEWQSGRLLLADDLTASIAAYRSAVQTLQKIRSDIASGFGNKPKIKSFREDVGQLYFDLADALLRRADSLKREKGVGSAEEYAHLLVQARDTIEGLKGAELEDYFQDKCVQQIKARSRPLDELLARQANTAVVYIIPLPDRIELLVSSSGGVTRLDPVPHSSAELETLVTEFRRQLDENGTNRYLDAAGQLYEWLIDPIEKAHLIQPDGTLVFVPDGALRTIPMGALYDAANHSFLIERYAVAITPGLSLMEPRPLSPGTASVLLNGLSDAVTVNRGNGKSAIYPALPNVPVELYRVRTVFEENAEPGKRNLVQAGEQLLPGGQLLSGTQPQARVSELMNDDFVEPQVESRLKDGDFAIVHIASHGHFGATAKDSYVVTYDGNHPLSLDDVQRLLRPKQLRGIPVELLTLSACDSAAGDDRAALGLAGVAVKSGARSALATLWQVDDAATAAVIGDFYSGLLSNSQTRLSKAQALRAAQIKVIRGNVLLRHPRFWAPYILIGNWL